MELEKTVVKKRLALFIALTFVISWVIFLLIPLRGYNPILGPAVTGLMGGLPFIVLAVGLLIKAGNKR